MASLFFGLTVMCRLPRGQIEPTSASVRICFVVRAAVSAILGVMLATPTSVLLQDPAGSPAVLWATAAAMVVQVILDVHVQNRSLKFNDIMFHAPVRCCFLCTLHRRD